MASNQPPSERSFSVATTATVAKTPILAAYGASAIETQATATSCTSGVKVAGWTISSVHGTIFGDAKIESFGERLCELAGCSVQMPEMPFTSSLSLHHESGFVLHLGCEPALEDWARIQKRNRSEGKAVPIMKVAATEEWKAGVSDANKAIAIGGSKEGIQCSEEHDWTYYTDFNGEYKNLKSDNDGDSSLPREEVVDSEGLEWREESTTGVEKALLTDTSVPILFFDELTLYEDELHDFGDMGLTVKVRVMPTCWYVLTRCFVRVDGVAIKCVESRIFHKFGSGEIWREKSERCADWSSLAGLGLGTNPRDHLDPNLTIPKLPLSPESLSSVPYSKLVLKGARTFIMSEERSQDSQPVDSTASMPTPNTNASGFKVPVRAIFDSPDMSHWLSSSAYKEILRFVRILSECSMGKPNPLNSNACSAGVQRTVAMLDKIQSFVAEYPPVKQPMRFGNIAFREWHQKLTDSAQDLVMELAVGNNEAANSVGDNTMARECHVELVPYLLGSFGDSTRIDFGTGHEVAFIAFLYGLCRVGVLLPGDAQDIATVVVAKYMQTMRLLQKTYMLEPAGSHGVWGLDDYHCLPFLIGSAQLITTNYGSGDGQIAEELSVPNCVLTHSSLCLDTAFTQRFHYLSAIGAVMEVKHAAPFTETSPMLATIANLPTWRKVHTGLLKHFQEEVLGKFPVIQHFLFGSFLSAPWVSPDASASEVNAKDESATTSPRSEVVSKAPWAVATTSVSHPSQSNHHSAHHLPPPHSLGTSHSHKEVDNTTSDGSGDAASPNKVLKQLTSL